MTPDIALPSHVTSFDGDIYDRVAEYLREQGYVGDDERVTGLSLSVTVEEPVKVVNYTTAPAPR